MFKKERLQFKTSQNGGGSDLNTSFEAKSGSFMRQKADKALNFNISINRKFGEVLLWWHEEVNQRTMPWKGEKDPYKIWLSEIILQQTRVEQGLAYYKKFTSRYPTVHDLASAPDPQVFKDWEGLGYYNRCKNLLATARKVVKENSGTFPGDYETLLTLKGVGPYTAAAISSFAFDLPYAVVDGNVYRVLSRVYGIDTPIDSSSGKEIFNVLARKNLITAYPALYNQAIMDFGATVCKPANPACKTCPMQSFCIAYQTGSVNKLPVKEKLLKKRVRHLNWVLLESGGLFYIQERTGNDIWQHLHEFYLIETPTPPDWDNHDLEEILELQLGVQPTRAVFLKKLTQQLTHQKIQGSFYHAKFKSRPKTLARQNWLSPAELQKLAFPKLLNNLGFFKELQK